LIYEILFDDRSKCIYLAEKVIEPGLHYTWKMVEPYGTIYVDPNVALLHHYRRTVVAKDHVPSKGKKLMVDFTAGKFTIQNKVARKVTQKYRAYRDICNLILKNESASV
jgi:hypothetical protein